MVNYIYQEWKMDGRIDVYKIDCGNLSPDYAIDVLRGISKNGNWINTFSKCCKKNTIRNAVFFAYAGVYRFYKEYDICSINYFMFNNFRSEFDFLPLAKYYKNHDTDLPDFANDFYKNWFRYQKEALIKNIIE